MMSDRREDSILTWLSVFYEDYDMVQRIVIRLNERDC